MFFSNLFGRRWSRVQLRVQKRNVGQAMVKEKAKNEKKEVPFGMCWSGDGQDREKEVFGHWWSGDNHEVTRKVKYWSHDRHTRVL